MSTPRESYQELFQRAECLDEGDEKVQLLERAVEFADAASDVDRAYEARLELVHAACFSGFNEKALVAFAWCLAWTDQDPERYPIENLLWKYKWVLEAAFGFPSITKNSLENLFDDFGRRYEAEGLSPRTYHYFRMRYALSFSAIDADVDACRREFLSHPRDAQSDCAACELNTQVRVSLRLDGAKTAISKAKPILSGRLRCRCIPHATYPILLLPFVDTGQVVRADEYFKRGVRLVDGDRDFVHEVGTIYGYLAVIGAFDRAQRLFERNLRHVVECHSLLDCLAFHSAACVHFGKLNRQGIHRVGLSVPASFPISPIDGRFSTQQLSRHFESEARHIAEKFDAREESRWQTQLLEAFLERIDRDAPTTEG